MTTPRRRVLAAALALTVAAGGPLVAGTAQAQEVTTGTLKFSGDKGDFITAGRSYSYSVAQGDALDVIVQNGGSVSIRVLGYDGVQWSLVLYTPGPPVAGHAASLVPGTYTDAHGVGLSGSGPLLDLGGDGRGCNGVTGSFTVKKSVSYPSGYVQALDVTFEQHCENGTPAARGEVNISNPTLAPESPTPPPTTAGPNATPTSGAGAALGAHTSAPATPVQLSTASEAEFVMVGAVGAWVAICIAALIAVGVLMAVRSRRLPRTTSQPAVDE